MKTNNTHSKSNGAIAEDIAYSYLLKQGFSLITKNFYSRFGEIDLIMKDGTTTVSLEVKMRTKGIACGAESITYTKQQKLVKTANYYLLKYAKIDIPCRFDAVIITDINHISWLKNIIS